MTKVLIVEDELSIQKLLSYDLKLLHFDVDLASDGEEALQKIDKNHYDVVLLDWMLPLYSGIYVLEKLRLKTQETLVFMLSAKGEESDILEAFEKGADDYLTKPFSPRVLSARIQAHLKRIPDHEEKNNLNVEDIEIDFSTYQAYIKGERIELTKTEFNLLVLLLRNINIVLSRDTILNEVWGFSYDGDTRIVDVHVFKLRAKCEASQISIESVRGVGYGAKIKK